ncbi:MAG: hypothetical protein QOG04_2193 [Actinomycetota bacterium]|nr:hypothetical protein [Actinomycetota bacterium]
MVVTSVAALSAAKAAPTRGAISAVGPSPSPSGCDDTWVQIDRDDRRSGNTFDGIAVRSRDVVFAVGNERGPGGSPIPLIKRWDGDSWDRERVRGSFYLHDVDVGARGPVWAVGEASDDTLYPFAVRRAGAGHWRKTEVARPGPTLTALYDVSALGPSAAWASGTFWDSSAQHRLLVERWDGKRWVQVEFSPLGIAEDIFARRADDIWVVGSTGRHDRQVTQTARHTARGWRIVKSPNHDTRINVLKGVVSTARDRAWAVGYYSDGAEKHVLILRWNGTGWSSASPYTGTAGELRAISAAGDELVAVGSNSSFDAITITFDGSEWTREVLEFEDSDELNDVAHGPDGSVFAAGLRSTSNGSEAAFYRPPSCP